MQRCRDPPRPLLPPLPILCPKLELPSDAMPCIIWAYWEQNPANLSPFRRLCVETWRLSNPGWQVVLLGSDTVWHYLDAQVLPRHFSQLSAAVKADAVRLAL